MNWTCNNEKVLKKIRSKRGGFYLILEIDITMKEGLEDLIFTVRIENKRHKWKQRKPT